jgi:hypothetical protein
MIDEVAGALGGYEALNQAINDRLSAARPRRLLVSDVLAVLWDQNCGIAAK